MVQRKAPHKIGSQAEIKRGYVKPERQSPFYQHQDTRINGGGGGGELKKKMKLERSIRVADLQSLKDPPMKKPEKRSPAGASPNYMMPTSSSDARKEQVQVTINSLIATDKKRSPRNYKNLNSTKPPSPSSTSPGLKLSKTLGRQSSLKAIRPLLMKNLKGVVVNRATCSSTLKDSKFPEALDLNPGGGGTEAEGISVMRVCPYTYCSLNGHRHEPLPPLKCFMSTRRRLLKTQKSMKLKGFSPLRVKVLEKDKNEIDTGQKATGKVSSSLEISPLMEDIPGDFFVEIYTASRTEEQIINENIQEEGETEKPQILKEEDQTNEPYADTIVEDSQDQSSELSNEEGDVMMSLLEYVECDPQMGDAEEEKTPNLITEDNGESAVGCDVVGLLGKAEGTMESENTVSIFDCNWEEEAGRSFPDNMTKCSECPYDFSGLMPPQTELSTKQIAFFNACDLAEAKAEQRQEASQEAAENCNDISTHGELAALAQADIDFKQEVDHKAAKTNDGMAPDGNLKGNNTECYEGEEYHRVGVLGQTTKPEGPESEEDIDSTCHFYGSKENISDMRSQGSKEVVSEELEEGIEAEFDLLIFNNAESGTFKPDDPEAQQNLLEENIKEDENANEVEDTNSLSIAQLFYSHDDLRESVWGITEDDHIQNHPEMVFKCENASISSDTGSCISNEQSDESDIEESWESENEQQDVEGSMVPSKARIRIRRKKTTEEPIENREFNPRPPRFLDVDSDPESEKIDLRHQLMDERKNSEEYLIDYALQRAVTKLAPARKRKVALLVEAFETVMPLPMCEKSLRHPTSGFIHARIMQACS